ncbi:caspase family protein [Streptomyces sp. NBC_00555]|uniref:caspase family protein n=1 Tax=Streptomyces sp. NBC_00555 TaxID=2903662 RepID=UPI00224D7D35|nr:caspase family protein [Streptomyces sp. NBC_00555]MCX5016388.1 caspase family protein [Streptomyces sp. NBC_00555]
MTGVPDPVGSRAVLIGGAGYRDLTGLPAVEANIEDLAAELHDATVWGLPERNLTLVRNPSHPEDLLDPVHQAGEEATDTLLVYFAGHGMRDADSADLFLALYGSRENVGYTAVGYQHLRSALRASRASRKVVILDCCFSGRAARTLAGGDEEGLAAQTAVEGAYVLTASPADRVALAPDGERHTAFTGELLKVLREGIPDGPELIDLDTLFRTLEVRLRGKNRPLPRQVQENGVGRLKIVRNRARAEHGVPAGPVLRGDLQSAMVGTGLALARTLRSAGRTRDALPVLRLALRERFGAGDGDLLAVQLELADMLAETGQLGEAIGVLEEAFVRVHRFHRPEAVLVCRWLAGLLQESGNHIHACEVLEHALDLIQDDKRARP